MSTTFLVSDLHFGHINAVERFTREDGSRLRDFDSVEVMNETIIHNWNSVVTKHDRVFVLGDVVINKKHIHHVGRLNGIKQLILGNHDNQPLSFYLEYFQQCHALKEFDGSVLTHIPVHHSQVGDGNRWKINVHGHLHDKHVVWYSGATNTPIRDADYYNVSVDCFAMQAHQGMNFFPKAWDQIKKESGI